jgi:hypothetical protein
MSGQPFRQAHQPRIWTHGGLLWRGGRGYRCIWLYGWCFHFTLFLGFIANRLVSSEGVTTQMSDVLEKK